MWDMYLSFDTFKAFRVHYRKKENEGICIWIAEWPQLSIFIISGGVP
jgi:hypothetical protein